MGMAAMIYKKGPPDNFVWEEIKVGAPEHHGQLRLRSTAVGVNFADTYHRAGIPHPMIVGDPPIVLGFEGVGVIEELGIGVTEITLFDALAPDIYQAACRSPGAPLPGSSAGSKFQGLAVGRRSTRRANPEGDGRAISPASNA